MMQPHSLLTYKIWAIALRWSIGGPVISVSQATEITLNEAPQLLKKLGGRDCDLSKSLGQVLAAAIPADRPHPPFHRVAMDGVAVSKKAWDQGLRRFKILGLQQAGAPPSLLADPEGCLEVMTGAALPGGCDVVFRNEKIKIENGYARVSEEHPVTLMQDVHGMGTDHGVNQELLPPGILLNTIHVGLLATVGATRVPVHRSPKVALVSTGDEIIAPQKTPYSFQIRDANGEALAAALGALGILYTERFHFKDDRQRLSDGLSKILKSFDVVIIIGGVSAGRFDLIPQILTDLQVEALFHKVRQRPGWPFWFGKNKDDVVVFGLPGNPVATLVCFHRYVRPFLQHAMGLHLRAWSQVKVLAQLQKPVSLKRNLTYFLPVALSVSPEAVITAEPCPSNGSGDHPSLIFSDGFMEIPEGHDVGLAGEVFPVYLWSSC
jgi:molybdopterin molybdotransferase